MLLKKVRGNKEEAVEEAGTIGLGFDKTRVEIRAKTTDLIKNTHRLEGNIDETELNKEKREK